MSGILVNLAMENNRVIFDLGVHTGQDTLYYLRKGFRVVGLEARADLCNIAQKMVTRAGLADRFTLVQRALFDRSDETTKFYVNDQKDDWGSLYRGAAEQGIYTAREIEVRTVTLGDMFDRFGTPYYIKSDMEGADSIFVEQLLWSKVRPLYVSIEATKATDVAKLAACGYTRFQLVNQLFNPQAQQPQPPREGIFVPDTVFTNTMSGPFGMDLPQDRWLDFSEAMRRLLAWWGMYDHDPNLAPGWLDVHATSAA
jgi:FkbM family methyltransferase